LEFEVCFCFLGQNSFQAGAPPWTPLTGRSPRPSSQWGIPLLHNLWCLPQHRPYPHQRFLDPPLPTHVQNFITIGRYLTMLWQKCIGLWWILLFFRSFMFHKVV